MNRWKQWAMQSNRLALLMFIGIAALFALYFGSIRFARGEWDQVPFETVVAGKALTPFQYRVLVPWVVGWAEHHVLPLPGIATGRKLAFLIEVGSIFGLLLVFRQYLVKFISPPSAASLLALTLLLILPFNYRISGMWMFWLWYDMPSLFLFTLGLLLLHEKKWWLYYPVFVLATLNRETSCFLTVIYVLTAVGVAKSTPSPQPSPLEGEGADGDAKHPLPPRPFLSAVALAKEEGERVGVRGSPWRANLGTIAAHTAAQLVIWLAIKVALSRLYAGNPGAGASLNNTMSNLKVLLTEPNLTLVLLSSLGYLWIPVLLYYPLVENRFVSRACLAAPLFLAVMFVSGNLPELRIYGEMIPVILPAFLLIVVKMVRVGLEPGKE